MLAVIALPYMLYSPLCHIFCSAKRKNVETFCTYHQVKLEQPKVSTESLLLCHPTQSLFLLQNSTTQCLALVQILVLKQMCKKCLTRCVYFQKHKGKWMCTRDVWKRRFYALRCFLTQYTLLSLWKCSMKKNLTLIFFLIFILLKMYPVVFILRTVIYLHPWIWRLCFSLERS